MDDFEKLFNQAEFGLWEVIAAGMAIGAFRHFGKKRRILAIGAVTFAIFGSSDWIEADTGAWWDPPWLLALKGACLITLILTFRAWLAMKPPVRTETPAVEPHDI